ncbi:MAG TPA: N-formylglutamate amidohydrolase [Rhizomicrobium sp.]|jgi:predicted N-formylglutamate amidohydrolase|nr:N-formylglutamate amidohydrolase [Rhizomicrobium sp.]
MTEIAFEAIPGRPGSPLLLLCDHASNALPDGYGTLGLARALFSTHIAHDIGAAALTRALAAAYGAPAFLGRWSRLLVDLNRGPDDPTLVMKLSDGSIIPGNRHADAAETARRIAAYHAPYHAAIAKALDMAESRKGQPIIISMHSFTPAWKGVARRWEVGVLYDRDTRLAAPLMTRLAQAGFTVGDNEPYSGALEGDTLNRHGTRRGLPHVLIEVRQDLIADDAAAQAFAARLKPILDAAVADMDAGGK